MKKDINFQFVAGILLLTILSIALPTAAFFTDITEEAEDTVTVGHNEISVAKTASLPSSPVAGVGAESNTAVSVKNTGNVDCYVRLKVVFSSDALKACTTLKNLNTSNWINSYVDSSGVLGGYYYYSEPLSAGQSTEKLFSGVSISSEVTEETLYNYGIWLYAESVQQGDCSSYLTAWNEFLN